MSEELDVKIGTPKEAYLTQLIKEAEDRIMKNRIGLDIDHALLDELRSQLDEEKESLK